MSSGSTTALSVRTWPNPRVIGSLPTLLMLAFPVASQAQSDAHAHEGRHQSHHEGLHFAHPLIAESVSPDTKLRVEHEFEHLKHDGGTSQSVALDGEYAFHPNFSVEVVIPVGIVDPEDGSRESGVGNVELALKFANGAFAESGLLLGYGIEFGLPAGDDEKGIGSDHILTYEPFLNAGYKKDAIELIGFARFGIPTRQREDEEIETEFEYNLSALYHVGTRVQGILEIDGERTLSGEETESSASVTPGIKVRPLNNRHLIVGFGVSVPIVEESEFDTRSHVSVFYHF